MTLRVILLLVGVALLTSLLWRLGPSEILDLLRRVGWYSVLVLSLYAAHHATRALALHSCVLRPGLLGYRDALAIRLSGEAIQSLTFTGPLLAEPTRAWLLKRQGLTLQEGFAATITEYLVASFVTAALSIAGLVYLVQHFDPSAVVAGIPIGVVIAFSAFLVASVIAIARRFYLKQRSQHGPTKPEPRPEPPAPAPPHTRRRRRHRSLNRPSLSPTPRPSQPPIEPTT